jgi:hypothetical protein
VAIRLHLERANVPLADASDDARAAQDAHRLEIGREADPARVKQPKSAGGDEIEEAAAFLEEAAPLRKEEREAIERDLLAVRFDLRETRISVRCVGVPRKTGVYMVSGSNGTCCQAGSFGRPSRVIGPGSRVSSSGASCAAAGRRAAASARTTSVRIRRIDEC